MAVRSACCYCAMGIVWGRSCSASSFAILAFMIPRSCSIRSSQAHGVVRTFFRDHGSIRLPVALPRPILLHTIPLGCMTWDWNHVGLGHIVINNDQ